MQCISVKDEANIEIIALALPHDVTVSSYRPTSIGLIKETNEIIVFRKAAPFNERM